LINEMESGEAARAKMALNDASRGMVAPEVKRAAEAAYKAEQASKQPDYTPPQPFTAPTDGVLSDRAIAANMLAQAKQMETDAKGLIAEAARMKKDAEKMVPGVNPSEATWTAPVAEAPKRKGRPPKSEAAVSDAV
jgi:hypothetical protein